ncbi:MAG TPA: HAMP domain-containing sensor histidine kinase [Vicinamibacteria bacterium]|nr:HAMP domain-containing sensor histidine kinase [Vicinamibacteria bacterium]
MSVRNTLLRLTHLGVTPESSPSDAKYITLTNSICLLSVTVSLIYLVVNRSVENPRFVRFGLPLVSAAVYAVPLFLNHRRRYWAATTTMCVAGLATQLAFTIGFGTISGNQFYFLPILGGVALLYPQQHRWTAVFLLLAGLLIFTSLVLWGENFEPLVPVDSQTSRTYYVLALIFSAALIVFISYYSGRRTAIAERQLEARSADLARALDELKTTQAQMIEAENQATLARLVAGLLHEVNTPIGAIRSTAETVKGAVARWGQIVARRADGASHAERESTLSAVEVCSELCESLELSTGRVSTVVEGLRQFVRLDEAERKTMDVREALDVTLALLGPSIEQRIEVRRNYPRSLPHVLCFPAKLNRTFLAVLQNAVQGIEGRGVIRVAVRELVGEIEIELADDGKGIPKTLLPEIFELGLTRKGNRVGLRLGLPLSKRSVEEIGGRLHLESTEGMGTTVLITLPVSGG